MCVQWKKVEKNHENNSTLFIWRPILYPKDERENELCISNFNILQNITKKKRTKN